MIARSNPSVLASSPAQLPAQLPIGKTLGERGEPDPQGILECWNWLSFHRNWGLLQDETLQAIAARLYLLTVETGTEIYQQGQAPIGVYLLKWGTVEIYRQSPVGKTNICYRSAGELFGYVPLLDTTTESIYQASAIALSRSEIWFLKQTDFKALLHTHADIQPLMNRLLVKDLVYFSWRISWEHARIQGLQTYIQPIPLGKPLLGQSKAAQKIAQQVAEAASDLPTTPIVLQGGRGTGKTFIAGCIHARSGLSHYPFAELDCAQLPRDLSGVVQSEALFGRDAGQPGLIELLERGTLLIENVHLLTCDDRSRLVHYLKTGQLTRNPAPEIDPTIDPGIDLAIDPGIDLAIDPGIDSTIDPGIDSTIDPGIDPTIDPGIDPTIDLGTAPGTTSASLKDPTAAVTGVKSWARLVLASPEKQELTGVKTHFIKLFNLLQRKDDIPEFSHYFLRQFCQEQGRPLLELNQGDLRRLISYGYPGNLSELAGILKRAVLMTPPDQAIVPEQVLWSVQSAKNAFRVDLLNQFPWLRRFLLSRWWPERLWIPMMVIFLPVTVLGFLGPQTRDANILLNFFWAWWWPGYLFLFVFVGRIWCAVCPFMITGEWLRQISLWIWPRTLRPWPTQWLNRWGDWGLFLGFVLIYLWEHLWDLPHTAYLSAWLLLIITAGAVLGSLIYERRLWCRYLCPIGGMNGLFAKLSIVEVRSTQQVCGSQCQTFGCYKGSAATPVTFAQALPNEGQGTGGCPLYSHPAQLQDNRDCVLCMTCLKACPHRSVQVNLRFPASDLLANHRGSRAEVALLLLLLGGVFMHHDRQILGWLGLEHLAIDSSHLLISLPVVTLILITPALLTYLAQTIARWCDGEMPDYLTVIYGYLPFTLAANLAHYIPAGMTEAGRILPVMLATLGLRDPGLPTLTWSGDVAAFLQEVTLLSGLLFSFYPLLRITKRPWNCSVSHLALLTGLTIVCFRLMVFS